MITRLIVIALLLFPAIMKAQTCEECKSKDNDYPYLMCSPLTGRYEVKCVKNPIGTGSKPWKLCFPVVSATIYDERDLEQRSLYWSQDGVIFPLFDREIVRTTIPDIIQYEYLRWVSICTPSGPKRDDNCQKCPIIIRWSKDKRDFIKGQSAVTSITTLTSTAGNSCDADCSGTYIFLNNSPEYIETDPVTKYPTRFFYTSTIVPNFGTGPYKNYRYTDLRLVISHELGHLMGFFHTKAGCTQKGLSTGTGIMSEREEDRTLPFTDYEKCMFKLLYCCDEQANDVEEEPPTINSTFNIFPNPTSSSVTIALSPSTTQYVKRLRVVDITGKTVFEQVFPSGSSNCSVQTNELTKGSYLFVMTFDGLNGSYSQKVIIQ